MDEQNLTIARPVLTVKKRRQDNRILMIIAPTFPFARVHAGIFYIAVTLPWRDARVISP
ncbi:hypothetical protein ACFO72_004288 [Enterobacter roggenkampii]